MHIYVGSKICYIVLLPKAKVRLIRIKEYMKTADIAGGKYIGYLRILYSVLYIASL